MQATQEVRGCRVGDHALERRQRVAECRRDRGAIGEQAIRLYWYFSRHVGIAGGIEQVRVDLKEYVSGDAKAKFEYNVAGLTFYLATAF